MIRGLNPLRQIFKFFYSQKLEKVKRQSLEIHIRSPLLVQSRLISYPPLVTKMFQFTKVFFKLISLPYGFEGM